MSAVFEKYLKNDKNQMSMGMGNIYPKKIK